MALCIRVQFLAGYSGREWPPSPGRLFKALVCAARTGWAASNRRLIDGALRELEGRAPIIAAPEAILHTPRQRRFVPNNSKNWPAQRKLNPVKGIDLEPEPILYWEINAPAFVWYQWPNAPSTLVNILRGLSRHTWSVGKGEDFALLDAIEDPPPPGLTYWREADIREDEGPWLEVPEPGCLDVCDAAFWRSADDPPLPVSGVRSVRYISDAKVENPRIIHVLALSSGGRRCSRDARLLRQIVGPVRNLLNEISSEIVDALASSAMERSRLKALTQRVLLGHDEDGGSVLEPHLAVLPIPSLLGLYPDGRIRRVALVDFGSGKDSTRRTIVEMAQILLHGRELMDNGRGTGVMLNTEPDRQWLRAITRRSRTWVSVTPVIQVAKELTSAEWARLRTMRRVSTEGGRDLVRLEQRREHRRLELLVRSLAQAIAADSARPVSVEVVHGGPVAGVHIAQQYRVNGYLAETPRLHVRVTFDRPVAGPIAIGRGRHAGFGLLWPDSE
jgi:CRISPR-associated protein Csb2